MIWRLAVDGEVGPAEEFIDLGAFGAPAPEDCFLNGIVPGSAPGTLIVCDQAEEVLWRIDTVTGTAERVDLGGASVAGDGLVWVGDVLYACDNSESDGVIQMWLTALSLSASAVFKAGIALGESIEASSAVSNTRRNGYWFSS